MDNWRCRFMERPETVDLGEVAERGLVSLNSNMSISCLSLAYNSCICLWEKLLNCSWPSFRIKFTNFDESGTAFSSNSLSASSSSATSLIRLLSWSNYLSLHFFSCQVIAPSSFHSLTFSPILYLSSMRSCMRVSLPCVFLLIADGSGI